MGPKGMDLGAKWSGASHHRLHREGTGDVRSFEESAGVVVGEDTHRSHSLGAIE